MEITLSLDDDLVKRVREIAHALDKSVDTMVVEYFEYLTGKSPRTEAMRQLQEAWARNPSGSSNGEPFRREDVYAERLDRPRGDTVKK